VHKNSISQKVKRKNYTDMLVSLQKNRHIPNTKVKQLLINVPDTHGIGKNVARFIKNEFGGYFLVHKGYKYIKRRASDRTFADIWICENGNDEKIKCPGEVLINKSNQIEEKSAHENHELPQGIAEMETFPTYKHQLSPENVKQLKEGKNLYYDGFIYMYRDNNSRTNKNNKTRLYYVCVNTYTHECKGKATVEVATNLIFVSVPHNHTGQKFISGIF
jgi:hypothetical protein